MINIFDFVQRNDKEIFKKCCSEVQVILETHMTKLMELRMTLYSCVKKQCKQLMDSQLDDDLKLINNLISVCNSSHKKSVFQCTISTLENLKEDFNKIDMVINNNLRLMSKQQMRSFSTNMKMFDNVINKRQLLFNYYYSIDDCDSPCKVKSGVFSF